MFSRYAAMVAVLSIFSVATLISPNSAWSVAGRALASDDSSGDSDRDAADSNTTKANTTKANTTKADEKPSASLKDSDDEPQPESAAIKSPRRSTARGKSWERETLPTTDAEWRRVLSASQYQVLRQHATEPAFSGRYWNTKLKGVYRCAGCGTPVFSSATKFNSGTGWPSYWTPYTDDSIGTQLENTAVPRVEVHCKKCKGHLGHVFNDGPPPTGLRFCINSVCLTLDRELPPVAEQKSQATGEGESKSAAAQP